MKSSFINHDVIANLQERNGFVMGLLLILIGVNAFLAMDMYVPSMPDLVQYFHTSTTAIKLTITAYLAGLVSMPLVYGPLSDAFGRRKILMMGLGISLIGSIVCLQADALWQFNVGRFIQGMGIAASLTLVRSMIKDSFTGKSGAIASSYVSTCFSIAPAVVPIFGGYLQSGLGWRSVFYAIMLYVLLSLLLIKFILPETNANIDRRHIQLPRVMSNYQDILTNRNFLCCVIISGLGVGIIIGYATVSSFLIQSVMHYSPIFNGWAIMAVVLFAFFGKAFNSMLLKRINVYQVMRIGLCFMLVSGAAMLLMYLVFGLSLQSLLGTFILYVFGLGMVSSNAMIQSFKGFKRIAGSAAAAFACFQLLIACLVSFVAAHLPMHNEMPLSLLILAVSSVAFIVYLINEYHRER